MPSFVDFEAVKTTVKIEEAAQALGLKLLKSGVQFRSPCPTCNTGGPRALVVTPQKGLFYCFASQEGGDVISLACHVRNCEPKDAAMYLAEQFGISTRTSTGTSTSIARNVPSERTAPQQSEGASQRPSPVFDPAAFAEKLDYTGLTITEDEARALGIGNYRGKLYQALRYDNGQVAGFSTLTGELKLPSKLLPQTSNVVQLKRA